MSGVVAKEDLNRLQRIVFRVSKGNVITIVADIQDQKVNKSMFMLVFSGGQHQVLRNKLNRVCDSLGATRYEVPRSRTDQKAKLIEVQALIQEQTKLEELTRQALDQIFNT